MVLTNSRRYQGSFFNNAVISEKLMRFLIAVLLVISIGFCLFVFNIGALPLSGVTISSSGSIKYISINPLHVEGRYIKDSSGQIITLTGVDYSRFIDGPTGDWILPNGQVEWATWDPNAAGENLDAMKLWGCNVVRTLATTEWWVDNVNNFQSNLESWIVLAAQRGMYVDLVFWRNNGTEQAPTLPYAPYDAGNNVMNSSTDFVNFWASVASELKSYPNVIFELWNEPAAGYGLPANETDWFNTVQRCVTAIRNTGASNPIVLEWATWGYDFNSGYTSGMQWVNQFPINDSLNNLVYSVHLYRGGMYNGQTGQQYYSYNDTLFALNVTRVLSTALIKPVWVGESGFNLWASDQSNETVWYNSTLSILNQYGIGYAAWWWWPTGTQFGLFITGSANYFPDVAGQILQTNIASSKNP
jgi:hypothetical protein